MGVDFQDKYNPKEEISVSIAKVYHSVAKKITFSRYFGRSFTVTKWRMVRITNYSGRSIGFLIRFRGGQVYIIQKDSRKLRMKSDSPSARILPSIVAII